MPNKKKAPQPDERRITPGARRAFEAESMNLTREDGKLRARTKSTALARPKGGR